MARDITVTLSNGEPLIYKNVPDDVTPDQITERALADSGGAQVVTIDGGRAAATDTSGASAPSEGASAAPTATGPMGPDPKGFESAVGAYYSSLKGGEFNPATVASLAEKYRVGQPTNLPEIQKFYEERGTLNPNLQMMGPEAKPPRTTTWENIVSTVPKASDATQRARAVAKGAFFDFGDELEAAGRMLASGELNADEYYKIKSQINEDYQAWSKANPGEALGYELAGGIGMSFVPGVGLVGKGIQGATGLAKLGSVGLRAAGTGALSGALSGVGQAETLSDIPAEVLTNAGIGLVTGGLGGKAFEIGGRGFARGRDAVRRRLGRETGDAVENRVAEVLYGSTPSPEQAIGQTVRAGKYGVPTPVGLATRELADLSEKVLARPSAGREAFATQVAETQADAGRRVQEQVQEALPGTKDYFDVEDTITANLRKIGDTEYQKAFAVGVVDDKQLINLVNNPELSSIWAKAQRLARLEGRELPIKMEAVLNEAGDTVGLRATDQTIPDVQSLHYLKRALDDTIDAGYRGSAGVGKAEASVLKESIRNPLVKRLDDLVPEYREARALYAGDMEVRDALRLGRDIMKGKMRSQQLAREVNGIPGKKAPMSTAEREALRTGARQSIFEPLEDATTNRNFAQRLRGIRGDSDTLKKLQLVMDPAEFRFFERSLKLEDELFKRGSKVMGGSRTVPLAQGLQTLDNMIGSGNISQAVEFALAPTPGRIATLARWVSNINPGKEFGDKVYTRLSQVLSANKPEELVNILEMLARSKSYGQYMAKVQGQATGRVASNAARVGTSALEDNSLNAPPTTQVSTEAEDAQNTLDAINAARNLPIPDDEATVPAYSIGGEDMGVAGDGSVPFSDGKASVGERNNNPGNLIVSAWTKKLPGYLGPGAGTNEQGIPFARFDTMEAGSGAKIKLVLNKLSRGYDTPYKLVESWLSPTNARNSPESFRNYVNYVAQRVGLKPNEKIPRNLVPQVSQAIREFETGDRP